MWMSGSPGKPWGLRFLDPQGCQVAARDWISLQCRRCRESRQGQICTPHTRSIIRRMSRVLTPMSVSDETKEKLARLPCFRLLCTARCCSFFLWDLMGDTTELSQPSIAFQVDISTPGRKPRFPKGNSLNDGWINRILILNYSVSTNYTWNHTVSSVQKGSPSPPSFSSVLWVLFSLIYYEDEPAS